MNRHIIPDRERIRQEVFRLANQKHLTISAIALRVGVSRGTVRNWLDPEVLDDVRNRHAEATYFEREGQPSWAESSHADCESVARWLEDEHGLELEAARMRRRKSSRITVWELDALLIRRGIHLEHLPDDVWVEVAA